MNKIPAASQNTEAKTLPADACAFGHFERLSPAAVYSADSRLDSGVKYWIYVSSIISYLCKNSFFVCVETVCKQCSESSMRCCFWSTVSKRGIHFEQSFLIDKFSCKIFSTLPSDFFNSSRNFHHTTCESTCDTLASSAANQGDNTVSVAQGGTATPDATEQLLPPD